MKTITLDLRLSVTLCWLIVIPLAGCSLFVSGRGEPRDTGWHAMREVEEAVRRGYFHDRDEDGLFDEHETRLNTDPGDGDTDRDGFSDGFENRFGEFGFSPRRPDVDSDRDGLTDKLEARLGSSPNDVDSDNDAWGDFDEYLNRRFGFDLVVPTGDSDFDGLADALELRIGTSPKQVDTNGDGVSDFQAYGLGADAVRQNLSGGLGELIGTTYSSRMRTALEDVRSGLEFDESILDQLPYPEATVPHIRNRRIRPSAALMQRSVFNPKSSPPFYQSYNDVVRELFTIAQRFDGNPGPNIVRLFVWSQPTVDCCQNGDNKPGRRFYALKISDNPTDNDAEPEVLLMGMHHARELITVTSTMKVVRSLTDGYAAGDPMTQGVVNNAQIWVLPVVNPNGYERAQGAQDNWRKNTRRVSAVQNTDGLGVDLNRNYGFGHASSMSQAQRASLPSTAQWANGILSNGSFDQNSNTFPAFSAFTEVETQAVRGLAKRHFLTHLGREEVRGIDCSLNWHSYGGVVGHPMGHTPIPPNTGLTPTDRIALGTLTQGMANTMAYKDIKDQFQFLTDPYPGYPVYGDSDDWLHKDGGTLSVLVEAYSRAEGQTFESFYPQDSVEAKKVANNNFNGAIWMIRSCPPR